MEVYPAEGRHIRLAKQISSLPTPGTYLLPLVRLQLPFAASYQALTGSTSASCVSPAITTTTSNTSPTTTIEQFGFALLWFVLAGAQYVQPNGCSVRVPRTSSPVMDGIVAPFVAGVSVGLGLGYRFCPSRAPQPSIPRGPSDPEVEHRRRRDLPASDRGGACTDWQYMLTREEGLDQGVRTTTWRSMSWCHSDVLEQSLAQGERGVEICTTNRKSWIVNFDRMEQLSSSSGRVRPVRRRLLCEQ